MKSSTNTSRLNLVIILIKKTLRICQGIAEVLLFPLLLTVALICRYKKKAINVGLGPEPIINNVYLKQALVLFGFSAETFVSHTYFITDQFDINTSLFKYPHKIISILYLYFLVISRYKIVYLYFNGGPLGSTRILHHFEPLFFRIAKTKTVVMPYGSDIQDFRGTNNLNFLSASLKDYPAFSKNRTDKIKSNIDKWTTHANHIISGCDWVEYMYHWDTLTLAYFAIDTNKLTPNRKLQNKRDINRPFKILHCPNHTHIKGSHFFQNAISALQAEGYNIELIFVQNLPNEKIKQLMRDVDVVADQLIIGWYAMTALEAMCYEKPVLCYIKPSLQALYEESGLLDIDELPVVQCNYNNVKQQIKFLIDNPKERLRIGINGRQFAIKHHSLSTIGEKFCHINRQLDVHPSR